MNFKRVLRTALSLVMIAALAMSMFTCNDGDKEPKDEKVFENQLVNDRYRFSQGYPEDWDYTQGEGGVAIRGFLTGRKGEGFLLAKLTSKTNANVVYNVYKYDTGSDISRPNDWMKNLMNTLDASQGTSTYEFNEVFFEEVTRDTYVITSNDEDGTAKYENIRYIPQVEWRKVEYSFVNEGEDWKGAFLVTQASEAGWFFLVTCEAKATEWDAAQATFSDMLKDFRETGRGGSNEK
ncbi:MAG: hypothetical protein J6L76_03200 [Clostridia bacterium]|nr:hypothetical protein [Clostridia bacterium]